MRSVLLAAVAATSLGLPAAAAVTTFSNRTGFELALPGTATTTLETFSSEQSDDVVTFSGITSTYVSNGVTPYFHEINGDEYELFFDGDGPTIMTWLMPANVIGFGFDVIGANPAAFEGAQLTFDDGSGVQTFDLFTVAGGVGVTERDGFAGFLGTGSIASVTFTALGGQPGGDVVDFDNLLIVTNAPAVPLPASGLLLLAGCAATAALRARKARTA